ncbi:MAG: hypothetical protein ABF709_01485 [Leuconostoc pseudomesenteroides]|uniref:hypothetical protein n=1 Tax=Leuconostoc pseudomesenteroides TaxID=33968 RepID=UPI0039ED8EA6
MMQLQNSVILNGNILYKSWRPVKEYLDKVQAEDNLLVERKIAEFVFKRIDKAKKQRFYDLNPNQGLTDVRCTPLDDENRPLLGYQKTGLPRFTVITTAKLLSHPFEVYEARIHLKKFGYNIVKRIVFKIVENDGTYYKVYTDYCDKSKYPTEETANTAVTNLAYTCESIVSSVDFGEDMIKEYFSEGVYVND